MPVLVVVFFLIYTITPFNRHLRTKKITAQNMTCPKMKYKSRRIFTGCRSQNQSFGP